MDGLTDSPRRAAINIDISGCLKGIEAICERLKESYNPDPGTANPLLAMACALSKVCSAALAVTDLAEGDVFGAGLVFLTGKAKIARGAAAGAKAGLPLLPKALSGGRANVHVYYGVRDGKKVYVGITNQLARRQAQHGDRFVLEQITETAVTRGQARAIEEALIRRNPSFENIRHAISPKHAYYRQAVDWGNAWLRKNGY